jgi:hypothetical protein
MDELIELVAEGLGAVGEAAVSLWEAAADLVPDAAEAAAEVAVGVAEGAGELASSGRDEPTTEDRGMLPWSR